MIALFKGYIKRIKRSNNVLKLGVKPLKEDTYKEYWINFWEDEITLVKINLENTKKIINNK